MITDVKRQEQIVRFPLRALRILGRSYTVTEEEPGWREESTVGECLQRDLTIKIDRGLRDEDKREVCLHECLHSIDARGGLRLSERQVTGLSVFLDLFLAENEDFRRLYEGANATS